MSIRDYSAGKRWEGGLPESQANLIRQSAEEARARIERMRKDQESLNAAWQAFLEKKLNPSSS